MIQIQGRYAWVHHDGRNRLLHVHHDERGDVKAFARGGWVVFAQARRSVAEMDYYGVRYPPDGIGAELKTRGIPFRFDEELGQVLVSVSDFQKFMQPLVLDPDTITEEIRLNLLVERARRLNPKPSEPKVTKVKKHPCGSERPVPTLDEKPILLPEFHVHPGASVDAWGPMLQTGMINEAFRGLSFYTHDCNLDIAFQKDYSILSVYHRDKPFSVNNRSNWPNANCRILVASKPLHNHAGVMADNFVIRAPSQFLIVDNYEYRGVRQITLLVLTETQVPFFLSGMAPQIMKLAKRARSDLHQKVSKASSSNLVVPQAISTEFATKPQIFSPYGNCQSNPAVIAWLADEHKPIEKCQNNSCSA